MNIPINIFLNYVLNNYLLAESLQLHMKCVTRKDFPQINLSCE